MFSDIVMPGSMNGIALAHEINSRYPHIPVLLASGYSDVVQANKSRFVILRKPFQLPALEKAMREVLERGAGRDVPGRAVSTRPRRTGAIISKSSARRTLFTRNLVPQPAAFHR